MQKLRWGLTVGLLVLSVVGAFMLWPQPDRISPENFDLIKPGMTGAEVEAILGGPPGDYRTVPTRDTVDMPCVEVDTVATDAGRFDYPDREAFWVGNEGYIQIQFQSGAVAEPYVLDESGGDDSGAVGGSEVVSPKYFVPTVKVKQSLFDNLRWRAKRQWHRWFPD